MQEILINYSIPLPWIPQSILNLAEAEAQQMDDQYKDLLNQSFRQHIPDHIIILARRYSMDAHSFAISFRRRGLTWAMQEIHVQRSISPDTEQIISREEETVLDDSSSLQPVSPECTSQLSPVIQFHSNLSFSFEE